MAQHPLALCKDPTGVVCLPPDSIKVEDPDEEVSSLVSQLRCTYQGHNDARYFCYTRNYLPAVPRTVLAHSQAWVLSTQNVMYLPSSLNYHPSGQAQLRGRRVQKSGAKNNNIHAVMSACLTSVYCKTRRLCVHGKEIPV
jgi:hypothetical protein